MQLNPLAVLEMLKSKNIQFLYHANTVQTACTFLQSGGLLSRGAVESMGLQQTYQMSDEIDKKFNVWNDIFLDSSDLHDLFNRQNFYGPVVFKYKVEVLESKNLPPIWVTKNNPIYWSDSSTLNDRYFQNEKELSENYQNGSFREMITLRGTLTPLLFDPYLEEIILDNPHVLIRGENLLDKAKKALNESVKFSPFVDQNVYKTIRQCVNCWCKTNYLREYGHEKLESVFLP